MRKILLFHNELQVVALSTQRCHVISIRANPNWDFLGRLQLIFDWKILFAESYCSFEEISFMGIC